VLPSFKLRVGVPVTVQGSSIFRVKVTVLPVFTVPLAGEAVML
jgi:hypothetical protein